MPNTGPRLGSLRQRMAFLPIRLSASPSPTVVAALRDLRAAGTAKTHLALPIAPLAEIVRVRGETDALTVLRAVDEPEDAAWGYVQMGAVGDADAGALLAKVPLRESFPAGAPRASF
jgi:hypothetical protein